MLVSYTSLPDPTAVLPATLDVFLLFDSSFKFELERSLGTLAVDYQASHAGFRQ